MMNDRSFSEKTYPENSFPENSFPENGFPENGLSEKDVFEELRDLSCLNTDFRKVMSSMCTVPHPAAVKAHDMFILSNLGDPGLFEGAHLLEKKVIRDCAELLRHPFPETACGHMTTGATESNIEAVYHMKYRFLKKKGLSGSGSPDSRHPDPAGLNLVVPASAHFSFEKACRLSGIEIRRAGVDSFFRADPASVRSLIDENTIGLVGIAGSTEFGYVDPVADLSAIAEEYDLPLHIDAAFGGFILPFLPETGSEDFRKLFGNENGLLEQDPRSDFRSDPRSDFRPDPCSDLRFDFSLPGVTSIALDPHKMGLSVIPSGIILCRHEKVCQGLDIRTHYLTYPIQSTITGTRTGASAAATYAVMHCLGRSGYAENVRYCLHLKDVFIKKAAECGLRPSVPPFLNIVTLPFDDHETVSRIRTEMKNKYGWHISAARQIPALRFVLMPHVTENDIDEMFRDLTGVLKELSLSDRSLCIRPIPLHQTCPSASDMSLCIRHVPLHQTCPSASDVSSASDNFL